MSHAVATPENLRQGEARLNELIQAVEKNPELTLLLEHLHSAHTYLLGAMPREFAASMTDARQAAARVGSPALRRSLETALDLLATETHRGEAVETVADPPHQTSVKKAGSVPPEAHSRLWEFFSTADVSFGVFYPKGHIIATFPSFESAAAGVQALRQAGFDPQEVVAARADEMLLFLEELKQHTGIWGKMMSEISQFFGTEEIFVSQDVTDAAHGAGFVAVYCPPDRESDRVKQLVEPFGPTAMQRYLASGIQSLI